MRRIICLFIRHKDGKKEVAYINTFGTHYMSKCQRCGDDIFYPNENEEEHERQMDDMRKISRGYDR